MIFGKYTIKRENNCDVLYIYMNQQNFFTEFARSFDETNNVEEAEKEIGKYIKKRKIRFKGGLVKVFAGSMLIGTYYLAGCSTKQPSSIVDNSTNSSEISSEDLEDDSSTEIELPSSQEIIEMDKALLDFDNLEEIIENFQLPLSGANGTTITWESTNPGITIENDLAIVTRSDNDDQVGDLIATLSYQDESDTQSFSTKVLMNTAAPWATDTEYTEGMLFDYNHIDNSYYADCSGINLANTDDIIIPSVYDGLPVRRVYGLYGNIKGVLRIGANVITIDDLAYLSFNSVEVSEFNPLLIANEDSLYKETALLKYFGTATNYSIPEGTTEIGHGAFINYTFAQLNFPSSVTKIRNEAFYGVKLDYFYIPDTVTSIDDMALAYITSTEVRLPNSITSLSSALFEGAKVKNIILPASLKEIGSGALTMTTIKSINLPNTLELIGSYAFYDSQIEAISFPESLKEIGEYAFIDAKISSIFIGKNVAKIGNGVFGRTKNLVSVNISPMNENFTVINNILYNKNVDTLIAFPSGLEGSIVIPDTVTEIKSGAFMGSKDVNLTLPSNLKIIRTYTFENSGIKKLVIPESVETLEDYAFIMSSIEEIYIRRTSSSGVIKITRAIYTSVSTLKFYLPDNDTLNAYKNDNVWKYYNPTMLIGQP